MTHLYFCPHSHHVELPGENSKAYTLKNPAEIAHCANCEYKEPLLQLTGRNRAEVVQTCTIYRVE